MPGCGQSQAFECKGRQTNSLDPRQAMPDANEEEELHAKDNRGDGQRGKEGAE